MKLLTTESIIFFSFVLLQLDVKHNFMKVEYLTKGVYARHIHTE